MTKTYELPLTRNYVSHWTVAHAVRELIQNAKDSGREYSITLGDDSIMITTCSTTLPVSSLLLGATDKGDSPEARGRFGEGYKLALLVLARNGLEVRIHNGMANWEAYFETSDLFGGEVLKIDETIADQPSSNLIFDVSGLSQDDLDLISANTLELADYPPSMKLDTAVGSLLRDPCEAGRFYVGGLFVCEDGSFQFGYDIPADKVSLTRDRDSIDYWTRRDKASDIIRAYAALVEGDDYEPVRFLLYNIVEGELDTEGLRYGESPVLTALCYEHYQLNVPERTLIMAGESQATFIKEGWQKLEWVSSAYKNLVTNHEDYTGTQGDPEVRKTPKEILESWEVATIAGGYAIPSSFEAVLEAAASWEILQ